MTRSARKTGKSTLKLIENLGLIVISIATLIAGTQEILGMVAAGKVTLADLLMLFIYLEVIAMVGLYLESGKLPVRMPIYIAIVALARYLALDIKEIDSWKIFAVSGAILILAGSVLLIRFGQSRFPYPPSDIEGEQGQQNSP